MLKMFSSLSLRCLLLLLLSLSASISCSSAAQRDSKLRLLLHRTPLLSSKQETSRSSLAELLLSDLLQMENEALEEDGFTLPEGEPEDIRLDLERAASSGPLLAPRERKAGCKNFFWKTFTSC
ncbi:somatostatin-1-like [Cyprinodon tularosa]|uniref:Somatostatin 1, tandem duplicate 1 n=1 Tax=Cyprinodon variegatus TaxID=28743 RepID=A0A3Q2DKV8_CYPVA|nr:PREDICTED: somatostatin-1-like [Cyprinodon variegatus]XP_038163925.1 somatostatin-1-like [Cyprinodon tularosa]